MTEEQQKAADAAAAAAKVETIDEVKAKLKTAEDEKLKTADQLKKAEFTIEELKKAPKEQAPVITEEAKTAFIKEAKEEIIKTFTSDEKTSEELKKALAAELGKNKGGSAASVKVEPTVVVEYTPQEKTLIERTAQRRGISFDEAAKLFKK